MSRCFVIAEAGVNHNGSVEIAKSLVSDAWGAWADAIKFQTYLPEKILRSNDPDKDLLTALALPLPAFKEIAQCCAEIGIEFMSTPECPETLNYLVSECGMKKIKIGSGDITNFELLEAAKATRLPVILSTGMSQLHEVFEAVRHLDKDNVTLLHCVSCYPCDFEDANLKAMWTLGNYMEIDMVGYSDHTMGDLACITAVAMGAKVIEKHFTYSTTVDGPDHKMSINRAQLREMIYKIRRVETLMGSGYKFPCDEEIENIPKYRKGADGKRGVA